MQFLSVLIVVIIIFAACILAMAVGLILRGRDMRGGCGSASGDVESGCGICPKHEIDLCENEDETGLAGIANLTTLGRFDMPQDPSGGNNQREFDV